MLYSFASFKRCTALCSQGSSALSLKICAYTHRTHAIMAAALQAREVLGKEHGMAMLSRLEVVDRGTTEDLMLNLCALLSRSCILLLLSALLQFLRFSSVGADWDQVIFLFWSTFF